jgi:hypothetical protein
MRFLILLLVAATANAQDLNRRVVGGDILYRGVSVQKTSTKAVLEAQNNAVRHLIVECGVAPAESKVYEQKVSRTDQGFEAEVAVGVDFQSCETTKGLPKDKKAKYSNIQLMKDFNKEDSKADEGLVELVKSGFEKINNSIEETQAGLQEVNEKIDRIESMRPVTIIQAPRPSFAQAQPSNNLCEQQAQRLLSMARMEAVNNTPPGNMAQGRAADYYNQAMSMRASCQN